MQQHGTSFPFCPHLLQHEQELLAVFPHSQLVHLIFVVANRSAPPSTEDKHSLKNLSVENSRVSHLFELSPKGDKPDNNTQHLAACFLPQTMYRIGNKNSFLLHWKLFLLFFFLLTLIGI